jgi:hypothetical protein
MQLGEHNVTDQPVRQLCMFPQGKCNVFEDIDIRQQCAILKQHAEAAAKPVKLLLIQRHDVDAVDEDSATIRQ